MAEPKLLQQQRELARYILQLSAAYQKVESEAVADFNAKKAAAEKTRQSDRQRADTLQHRAVDILQTATNQLNARWKKIVKKTSARPFHPGQGARDSFVELPRCVNEVEQTRANLQALINSQFLNKIIAFIFGQAKFKQISAAYAQLLQLTTGAQYWHGQCLRDIEKNRQNQITQASAEYQQKIAALKKEFSANLAQVAASLHNLSSNVDKFSPGWKNAAWNQFVPAATLPPVIRLGELQGRLAGNDFFMPALFPFPGERSILISAPGADINNVASAIQALALRLLATIPAGKLQFIFLDPVALGQNVAPFMRLADHDETLIHYRAWTEANHIEQQLLELTEHIENVIQKYIRNEYKTIEEYNTQAGEVAEAYRFLVVMNFPVNFSDSAAKRLVSITQNGPRCGVYTIIFHDREKPLPHGFQESDLQQGSLIFQWDGQRFIWQDPDFRNYQFKFETPPSDQMFNTVMELVGREVIAAKKVEVPFVKILQKIGLTPDKWWQGSTLAGVQAPLGPIGAKKVQLLELGKGTSQHVLIGGKTGSGKSNLIHVLITSLAVQYSPDEIEFYLIDFKKGVEFKTYATHQLPHARVIAIESEREFGLSLLEGLDGELKRRGDLFRNAGVDNLKDYREKGRTALPRVLLLVDEFQEFFTEDDGLAQKAAQILDRLVRQGRAFGIHIVLGSQTLAGSYTLARSTVDQMAVRIALQCSEADSRLILSDDNPAARSLSRPGDAIYNAANGLVEGNNPFQVAFLSPKEHEAYLVDLRTRAQKNGYWPLKSQIVFEGNAPADAERNLALNEFLLKPRWSPNGKAASAWVGEPIAIKDATTIDFRRQSGSHLLILGQKEEAVLGVLTLGILSLSVQQPRRSAQFYVLDCTATDVPHANFLENLQRSVPQEIRFGLRKQLPDLIKALSEELEQRLQNESANHPTIYLIINGLQRAKELQPDETMSLGWPGDQPPPPSPATQFAKILREGPELGIHCLVWCDTFQNLNRRLGGKALREFDLRIAFQMSHDDSTNFVESPAASKLGQYRALFYSEENGRQEKFRPYALPADTWLSQIGKKLCP